MVLENDLPKERLATACDRPHAGERHALPDDGKRVPREIQVGDRVDKKVFVLAALCRNDIGKGATRPARTELELVCPDTFYQLVNKSKWVLNPIELVFHNLENRRGRNARLRKPAIQKLFSGSRVRCDRLGNKLI